ncbi:MAG: hypothetical protein HYV14_12685 [Elusimicrobia bacterium]|nr:hypothetical protein [Elusimicrobiota bacterium]
MLTALTVGVPLVLIIMISLAGAVLASEPLIGSLLLALLAVFVRVGLRVSRDQARPRWLRRLSLASALGGTLFGALTVPSAFIGSAHESFAAWHASGGGLKPGMTVEEARSVLARKGTVTEIGVGHAKDFHGTRFEIEPTGLAAFRFQFPLAELYYLDVALDEKGRVAAVKPWND